MPIENGGQQIPGGSSHIGYGPEAGEVVSRGYRGGLRAVDPHHGLVEQRCFGRVVRQPVEKRHAEGFPEPRFPRPDGMLNIVQ